MLLSAISQLRARPASEIGVGENTPVISCAPYVLPRRRIVTLSCGGAGRFYWEPHTHSEHELFWDVTGGPMLVSTPGRMWVVPPGGGLWIPAGTPHDVHLGEATRFEASFIAPSWCDLPAGVRALRVPRVACEIMSFLTLGAMAGEVRARAEQLVVDILAIHDDEVIDLPMPLDPRLRRVVQFVLGDLAADRTLEAWSAIAAMSPRNFTRRFRAETAMSFGDWRTLARMRLATTLLAGGEPVARVAARIGYANPSAFTAAFRRVTGRTPAAIAAVAL